MALFKKTKKEEETKTSTEQVTDQPKKAPAKKAAPSTKGLGQDLSHILLHPRITEKATDQSVYNAYVFDVAVSANKKQIAAAVQRLYKVTPTKVRVVNVPTKRVRHARTGIVGKTAASKKAYVYLKKGETISVM